MQHLEQLEASHGLLVHMLAFVFKKLVIINKSLYSCNNITKRK